MSISNIILQLSIWSILLPLVAGLLFLKKMDEACRIVFSIVVLATIPQLLTTVLYKTRNLNVVYNIYTLVEFMLVYFLLGYRLQHKFFNCLNYLLIGLFYVLSVVLIFHYGFYQKFLNELVCAANTVYLIWVFSFILEGLLTETRLMNARLPMFWFVTALLIYTPTTIFVFAMTYYIEKSTNPVIHNLWSIQGVFNTLMYLFFAIGFYKSYQQMRKREVE